jgi:hypothetical protein
MVKNKIIRLALSFMVEYFKENRIRILPNGLRYGVVGGATHQL